MFLFDFALFRFEIICLIFNAGSAIIIRRYGIRAYR